ncbi:hypothetical protein [Acinetobacter sp. NIPH 298]|uniref:hypothetical protein n=1 Tax=Acinetobacter sp. NIPH 298 TaxID=1217692 RepID=UPI0002CF668E|nr:hypothetical protein [Acinetobacter sp. NIPH 298]ENW95630.1 hypothetical protein F903_01391 [Acinetobacter sp. NIPH 298]
MKFDLRFNYTAVALLTLLLVILFLTNVDSHFLMTWKVHLIEDAQALVLLACVAFTWFYMKPKHLTESKKLFWLWAIAWWFMFFGRSISWGRDYFPDIPHLYFRIISIFVIAPVVFMPFLSKLREEIKYKLNSVPFPFWYLLIACVSLFFADSVEHHRFIDTWLLSNTIQSDVVEELYEVPFILALFCAAFYFMQWDKIIVNETSMIHVEQIKVK